jgi:hypothetical protein
MEIIEEFEGKRRGPYAGAVGYITFPIDGKSNIDFCITIRTIIQRGRCALIQTGAGIVADSDPVCEHQECVNKARALAEAIRVAEQGLWERGELMIVVIDNYDSFTYNLVQYLGELGADLPRDSYANYGLQSTLNRACSVLPIGSRIDTFGHSQS